jgi:hypothetical protein
MGFVFLYRVWREIFALACQPVEIRSVERGSEYG